MRSRTRQLKKAMAEASTYQEWKDAALELDELQGNNRWKKEEASELYNYRLVRDRLEQLRLCHKTQDTNQLVRYLREGLHHDLGNMGSPLLYAQSHVGTKELVEDYIDEVCFSLNHICDNPIESLPYGEKLKFFRDTAHSYGRPALLLSGGATSGVFHLGAVKALWEKGLLPKVLSGSSVGAFMAGIVGTHKDEELARLADPHHLNLKAWRWLGLAPALAGQGLMDIDELETCIRSNLGELTFAEAYERTGRSTNITVSPVSAHHSPRLLSHYTSPYLLLWSAALASCAVPIVFPPVTLTTKNRFGELIPYMPLKQWVDGSVKSDQPMQRLTHLYDVNYYIVSQTNPHIAPFVRDDFERDEQGLLGLPKRIAKAELQFHGKGAFGMLRKNAKNETWRQLMDHAYTIVAQKYYGDVTIAPRYRLNDYINLMRNPSPDTVKRMMLAGERATWPKMGMIRSHAKISQTLENCIQRLENRRYRRQSDYEGQGPAVRVVDAAGS